MHSEIDPVIDLETVETELLLADLETISNAKQRLEKASRGGDKEVLASKERLEFLEADLNKGVLGRHSEFYINNSNYFKELQLITTKPCVYIANVEDIGTENSLVDQLVHYAKSNNSQVLILCNQIEAEIAELDQEEGKEFLEDLGMDEPGLNKLIKASYEMLKLQTFFTAGEKEVRAWTIRSGSTAPQAAGEIHTDFEKGFIRAETIGYEDFINHKGEGGAKEAGRLKSEGSEYIVKDGDVIHFRFNV